MPDFLSPQLCTSVQRPPSGAEWVHEIKFDGYRIQLRVEGGEETKDAQRPRLDKEVPTIADAARIGPTAFSTARSSPWTRTARRISRRLQAALSKGRTQGSSTSPSNAAMDRGRGPKA